MTRSLALVTEVVLASRPLGDWNERERAVTAVLDAVQVELVGAESLREWADRLAWHSSALALADRFTEARMMVAAARVIAA